MDSSQIIIVLSALFFIIALLLVFAWIAKRGNWISKKSNLVSMEIVGSKRLGAKSSLLAVKVDDKCILLGVTPHSINKLHVMPTPAEAEQEEKFKSVFEKIKVKK